MRVLAVSLILTLVLSACGGGEQGTGSTETTILNTAAAEAPLEQGQVAYDILATQSLPGSVPAALRKITTDAPRPDVQHPASAICTAGPRPTLGQGSLQGQVSLVQAFPNLAFAQPLIMIQEPGNNSRWYVGERAGRLYAFDNTPSVSTRQTVLDISSRVDSASNQEAGFLGAAFHPNYAQNGYVFLSYTRSINGQLTSIVSRVSRLGSGLALDPDPTHETILLSIPQPWTWHNGGHIAFGQDGYLYIAFGDGGAIWESPLPGPSQIPSQNPQSLLGKILRIDVNSASPYGIPASNPYVGGTGRPEIFASGFRNPWRFSIDRGTGQLWAGDVGELTNEEIDLVESGKNYGWNFREGDACFNTNSYSTYPSGCQTTGLTDPVAKYTHSNGRCAITGGPLYRGSAIAAMNGKYLYGDFCTGEIWALNTQTKASEVLAAPGLNISSFAEDQFGEPFVVSFSSGKIHKLVPGNPSAVAFPTVLSQTGCVNMGNPYAPASGTVAMEINSPFWTDGAEKTRFLSLPKGTQIGVGADGDWTFPVGTVLVKHLQVAGTLLETRLLMRHTDGGWAGYSYKWNSTGTDAVLLADHLTETINGVPYDYPSGAECLRCHTSASGVTLGPETGQMNRRLSSGANQAELFKAMGLLPQSFSMVNMPFITPWADTRYSVAQRARGYLHTNCSHCHRPGGGTPSDMDLRFSQQLWKTKACDVAPVAGSLGLSNARLIAPGAPARSVLLERMKRLDSSRMPPLTTHLADQGGIALVEQWIAQLQKCQ